MKLASVITLGLLVAINCSTLLLASDAVEKHNHLKLEGDSTTKNVTPSDPDKSEYDDYYSSEDDDRDDDQSSATKISLTLNETTLANSTTISNDNSTLIKFDNTSTSTVSQLENNGTATNATSSFSFGSGSTPTFNVASESSTTNEDDQSDVDSEDFILENESSDSNATKTSVAIATSSNITTMSPSITGSTTYSNNTTAKMLESNSTLSTLTGTTFTGNSTTNVNGTLSTTVAMISDSTVNVKDSTVRFEKPTFNKRGRNRKTGRSKSTTFTTMSSDMEETTRIGMNTTQGLTSFLNLSTSTVTQTTKLSVESIDLENQDSDPAVKIERDMKCMTHEENNCKVYLVSCYKMSDEKCNIPSEKVANEKTNEAVDFNCVYDWFDRCHAMYGNCKDRVPTKCYKN